MPRRTLLALALVSTLTGCVAAPPTGAFVECRDGQAATTRAVKCEADYRLVATAAPGGAVPGPFGDHHVTKGGRIGFRREADGSLVAVAPGYTLALPPGAYSWEVVPESVPSLRERQLCEARGHFLKAAKITGIVTIVALAVLGVLVIVVAIALANSNFPNFI